MVHAKGARLGLAHADASESHATTALADERLIVQRRWSQDDSSSRELEHSRTEDRREATDRSSQDDRKAHYREAQHGEAQHGQAQDDRETDDSEARRPQDHGSPEDRRALDGEAHDTPHLRDAQEAPLGQAKH